jgi:hypothetical protein
MSSTCRTKCTTTKKGRTDGADNVPIANAGSPIPAKSNTYVAAGTVLIADGAGATDAMTDSAGNVLIADATGASNAMMATAGDVLIADPVGSINAIADATGKVLIADATGTSNAMTATASDVLVADLIGAINAMADATGKVLIADATGAIDTMADAAGNVLVDDTIATVDVETATKDDTTPVSATRDASILGTTSNTVTDVVRIIPHPAVDNTNTVELTTVGDILLSDGEAIEAVVEKISFFVYTCLLV